MVSKCLARHCVCVGEGEGGGWGHGAEIRNNVLGVQVKFNVASVSPDQTGSYTPCSHPGAEMMKEKLRNSNNKLSL